ncbi:hypothetical protein ACFTXL_16075 [Bacillus subtilis]|nr:MULTISPECIES: hypothetical protein [Bacillus]KIN36208.1 hypothetical protein B4070_4367 [Bacillus subtilis]MCB4341576.1 hypothetical protein [Bacillus subtilis]MCZ4248170.1 hypothetical protein [Bacillus amyloliquefaciens]MDN4182223.1 hypothetical protein [Bacillus subtilis]WBC25909.1 hypothetical protein O6U12_22085 [Bacillus subtilis]
MNFVQPIRDLDQIYYIKKYLKHGANEIIFFLWMELIQTSVYQTCGF